MVMGTTTAYAAIARFPPYIAIQTLLCLLLACSRRSPGRCSAAHCGRCSKFGPAVRAFNVLMALLLLASLYPVFRDT